MSSITVRRRKPQDFQNARVQGEPPWLSFLKHLQQFISPFLGIILGALLTYHFGLKAQIETGDRQKRQQVYSQLMGKKHMIGQLYTSRLSATIMTDYHTGRYRLEGSSKESFHLQEAQRRVINGEELALEIAKTHESICELIGTVKLLFLTTPKLTELTEKVCNFKAADIREGLIDNMNFEQLENFRREAHKHIHELVRQMYEQPIDDLLNYLLIRA